MKNTHDHTGIPCLSQYRPVNSNLTSRYEVGNGRRNLQPLVYPHQPGQTLPAHTHRHTLVEREREEEAISGINKHRRPESIALQTHLPPTTLSYDIRDIPLSTQSNQKHSWILPTNGSGLSSDDPDNGKVPLLRKGAHEQGSLDQGGGQAARRLHQLPWRGQLEIPP